MKTETGLLLFVIGWALTLLLAGIRLYVTVMTRMKEFEMLIQQQDQKFKQVDERFQRMETNEAKVLDKLDDIYKAITSVKIELSNKENRK